MVCIQPIPQPILLRYALAETGNSTNYCTFRDQSYWIPHVVPMGQRRRHEMRDTRLNAYSSKKEGALMDAQYIYHIGKPRIR